jgi:pyrimidine oxygenase
MALELGIFLPVTNNGWILSPSAPPAPPTFALNRAIAGEAERRGFHFLLAQSVWRGHGGVTDFWNTSLEGFTLMSALGAVTERLGLVASVQPLLYPPPVAAKMVATADDISGGRFGINVVAGANLTEFEQMSVLPPNWADVRYDYASEWIESVKRLWGDEPSVATDGDWIRLAGTISNPKPRQDPHPPIVCAGSSPRGMRFALEHGTHAFIGGTDLDDLAAIDARYRAGAAELGRTIKTYTAVHYLIADTDEAAAAEVQRYRAILMSTRSRIWSVSTPVPARASRCAARSSRRASTSSSAASSPAVPRRWPSTSPASRPPGSTACSSSSPTGSAGSPGSAKRCCRHARACWPVPTSTGPGLHPCLPPSAGGRGCGRR